MSTRNHNLQVQRPGIKAAHLAQLLTGHGTHAPSFLKTGEIRRYKCNRPHSLSSNMSDQVIWKIARKIRPYTCPHSCYSYNKRVLLFPNAYLLFILHTISNILYYVPTS